MHAHTLDTKLCTLLFTRTIVKCTVQYMYVVHVHLHVLARKFIMEALLYEYVLSNLHVQYNTQNECTVQTYTENSNSLVYCTINSDRDYRVDCWLSFKPYNIPVSIAYPSAHRIAAEGYQGAAQQSSTNTILFNQIARPTTLQLFIVYRWTVCF